MCSSRSPARGRTGGRQLPSSIYCARRRAAFGPAGGCGRAARRSCATAGGVCRGAVTRLSSMPAGRDNQRTRYRRRCTGAGRRDSGRFASVVGREECVWCCTYRILGRATYFTLPKMCSGLPKSTPLMRLKSSRMPLASPPTTHPALYLSSTQIEDRNLTPQAPHPVHQPSDACPATAGTPRAAFAADFVRRHREPSAIRAAISRHSQQRTAL